MLSKKKVIALRKWSYWCPFCWASLPQRSLLDSGAAGGGAVTYCCRSLSCDGHSLALCGCLCLLVARNIGLVRVHVCRAKRCVLRTDGHEPFSFLKLGALYALAVPDSFSLRRRFYLRSIVRCVLNLLGSMCIAFLVSLSVLSSGRRLRSLFAHGHCAVRASPSTFGYALLAARAVHACLLRGVSDWNPARLQSAHSFAWVQCRSVADASSLSRMSALLTGSGAICAQTEVCHYRGDQLAGRHLLMRFRSSVSIAPVLSDMCSADLGDSAPPLVTLMATPRPMRLAMLACSRVMRLVEVLD